VAGLIRPLLARYSRPRPDGLDRLTEQAAGLGLRPSGLTGFTGLGQGRSPHEWRTQLLAGRFDWTARAAGTGEVSALCDQLAALPGPHEPRPDPVYRLAAFTRAG
jgi:hypothetical protein